MISSLLRIGALLVLAPVLPIAEDPARAEEEVRALLAGQVEAWNRGDLEGYMGGYWDSPRLSFFSDGNGISGWEPTLERYRRRYRGEGREMGMLEFRDLEVEVLGPDAVLATGSFHLEFSSGETSSGLFSLILRRFSEGWRIVHDHTSSGS